MQTLIINHIKASYKQISRGEKSGYLLLYGIIRDAIENGKIPNMIKMPPSRLLGIELGISRSTVVKAYDLLIENRLLSSSQGSGYVVTYEFKKSLHETTENLRFPKISETGQSFLNNIDLLSNSTGEGVAFTPGLPPLDVFPISQWQKLTNLYWRNIKTSELNYSVSSGLESLKQSIADYLQLSRNIKCITDQVIIVSGSLQSLYLIGTVLIDKGDKVVLENSSFPNVISTFRSLQAEILPAEVDKEGLVVSNLYSPENEASKLVHITPSNYYPIGGKISLDRRLELLEWASKHSKFIIENDYEHEINNSVNPIPSIYSLDKENRTIYLGTFNRIMHPSIRLGYMIAPPHLLPAIKALQMHSHRFVPQSIQVVMNDFMNQNFMFKHIRNAIHEAQDRKIAFVKYFNSHFPNSITLVENSTPSFHLLAKLNNGMNDNKLVKLLEAQGINTHAQSKCEIVQGNTSGLILGFSAVNKAFMIQNLERMLHCYTIATQNQNNYK